MAENVKFVVGSYNPWKLSTNKQQELIQNLLKLGEWEDDTTISIDDMVNNFGVAKTDIWFFDELHAALKRSYPNAHTRSTVMSNAIATMKDNELYSHLSMITRGETTPYHSLQHVKKYIWEYYEMLYKFVEREAIKPEKDQLHSIEDAFNRTDPLFWVALFLYQKELNITTKFLTKLNVEISQKRKLMKFLQDEDIVEIMWNEKKFKAALKERYMLTFSEETKYIEEFRPSSIDSNKWLKGVDAIEVGTSLEKEIAWKWDISTTLGKEHSPFEKFFAYTREYAKWLNTNNEIMRPIRENLRSMSAKFNSRHLNPLKSHVNHIRQLQSLLGFVIKNKGKTIRQTAYTAFKNENDITLSEYDHYFENVEWLKTLLVKAIQWDTKIASADKWLQDILWQEFQFMQTMAWFWQDKYSPHFVKNINLAWHNIWIPRSETLKWRLDKICGTLKERRTNFTFTTPSMKVDQLLLTSSQPGEATNFTVDIADDVKAAADKLFSDLLSDEI